MGTEPRAKPRYLPKKLRAIRKHLGASQSRMVTLLEFDGSYARISEWENGIREPDLFLLLRYARLVGISTDMLIDDEVKVAAIRRGRLPH